jgi:hypothetical protein
LLINEYSLVSLCENIFKSSELYRWKQGDSIEMKKSVSIAISLALLCILVLPTAFVYAVNEAYSNTDYSTERIPVIDGKWTTTNEWTDAAYPANLPAGVHWSQKWEYRGGTQIVQYFLFEAYTDNTNDAGDYVQLCYDCTKDGGTAPNSNDVKFEIKGHGASALTVYVGNGTGWAPYTGTVSLLLANHTIGTSVFNSTYAHWIVELSFEKAGIMDISGSGYAPAIKVAWYDASNSAAGVKEWPPASGNDPSKWGVENGVLDVSALNLTIPEPLTIAAVVLLSLVAVLVGFRFMRGRPKAEHFSAKSINPAL